MRKLIFIFVLFPILALAGEPIYDSNGVTLTYDKETDTYEVRKNGVKDSNRMIQSYWGIEKMTKLLKDLGGDISEELPLILNNNLTKTLKTPTEKQVMEVGIKQLEETQLVATAPTSSGKSCSVVSDAPLNSTNFTKSKKKSKQKGWFCATPSEADLSPDFDAKKAADEAREKRSFMKHWLGDDVRQSVTLDTYNDNFLHGGGIALTGEQTADDRARTYGHALEYEAEGEDGSFKMRYNSQLFSRETTRVRQVGSFNYNFYRDEEGKKYLEAMEETTLSLRGTRNFVDNKNLYGIGSFEFKERTDKDRGTQSIQDVWHEASGSVRYNYLEHMDDEYSVEAKAGVGIRTEGDLGKWRCRATLEGLAGVDVWTMDRAELEINASIGLDSGTSGGREKDNPWLAIDAYTRQSIDTEGEYDSMYGAKVSTSFKWGETSVQPYLGVEYYDEASDRRFQTASEGNELIHTIGVKLSF